jgi:hypothetical protein
MSWSKQEEIAMLRKFVARLGDRNMSYCGEWLTAELPALERAIMDDVPAECYAKNYREAEAIRTQIIADAKASAERMDKQACDALQAAKKIAADLVAEAERRKIALLDACNVAHDMIRSAHERLKNV